MIRHELNTPLATALLYIGIAEGSAADLPEGIVKSALRVARSEVQRLKTLIDTMTELECSGYATIRPRSFDVGDAIRATVQRMIALRDPTRVRVLTTGDLRGWWDRPKVEQIVGNLLSNALKFGLERPVRVEVRRVGEGMTLTVRDHGIGIAAADQEWIFERNAHASPERGGGLGLGLWLVRELATAHGGWVALDSRKGRGATFTVFLRGQRQPAALGRMGGVALADARPAATLSPRYWQVRAVKSHRKVPLLARNVTVDPVPSSATISPSVTGTLKPSRPSKTRKSIEGLAV
ncbi:MAG TPA: HAMP domain-containing sensor histidine kinase [Polyangia bacterium]|nr:HAMP domain-containing sensor histidine kinase [Polyangia bacterium]